MERPLSTPVSNPILDGAECPAVACAPRSYHWEESVTVRINALITMFIPTFANFRYLVARGYILELQGCESSENQLISDDFEKKCLFLKVMDSMWRVRKATFLKTYNGITCFFPQFFADFEICGSQPCE